MSNFITVVRKQKDKDGKAEVKERRVVQASMIPDGFEKEAELPKPRVQ